MALTEKQKTTIAEAISRTLRPMPKPCPMCESKTWDIVDDLSPVIIRTFSPTDQTGSPKYIPAVTTVCKTCGFIAQFSSKTLAGLPEEKPE